MKSKLITRLMAILIPLAVFALVALFLYHPATLKLPQKVQIETTNQPTIGNLNAKLHFVVFEDLKCYNCMRFNVEILPEIKEKYINTKKAKYTVITLAFLPGSLPAANAAHCLYSQNKKFFFLYLKNIYNNQPPEQQNWATLPNLVNFANEIPGVDKTALSLCIFKSQYTESINKNLAMASKIMGGTVFTPSLYINGYLVQPITMKNINQTVQAIKHD